MHFKDKPYWNPNVQDCVSKCPASTPEKWETKTCTPCSEIYPDAPQTFWDPVAETCVTKCPETVEDGQCETCKYVDWDYPYWSEKEQKCLTCDQAFPGENRIWDSNVRECVSECLVGKTSYYDGGLYIDYCSNCDDSYKPTTPFWNGAECVACPPERPNWDDYLNECTAPCPSNAPAYVYQKDDKNTCKSCHELSHGVLRYWDSNRQQCVFACDPERPVGSDMTCVSCAEANESTPFWNPDAEECVSSCPEARNGSTCRTCY